MGEPDNVVGDVHGGVAGLVDEGALVQSPEHLETQEAQCQHHLTWARPSSPLVSADKVQRLLDLIKNLDMDLYQVIVGPFLTHLGLICVEIKHHQEQEWNIDTAEDVEMREVGLGNADQLHQGVLHRTIQGLAIPEQLQYKQR